MKVADTLNSHPNKPYNSHIKNINDSFIGDAEHIQAGSYHDLAKLIERFQLYINLRLEKFPSKNEYEKERARLKTTHALEGALIYFFVRENKDIDFLANFFTILKHHSDLPDILHFIKEYLSVINSKNNIKQQIQTSKKVCEIASIEASIDIRTFIKHFLLLERNFNQYQNLDNFFLFKKRYSRLILADKFEAIFSKPYQNVAILDNKTIDNYIGQLNKEIGKKEANKYKNKAREIIFKNYESNTDKNKFLIKAPTGIGKTFLALNLALCLAKFRGDKRRIITAIPFTSIIDQTHIEYEKIIGSNKVLKYHHLTSYKKDDNDEVEQLSQKLFLADIWQENFIVTTFNQLFYTFFSNHNRDNIKLETLRDSVIIIDEIQNIPRVLLKQISIMFNEFAKRYNIDFILMSATMPCITQELENFTELSSPDFYRDKKDRYRLIYKPNLSSFESVRDEILRQSNKSVLCVVNTILKAKTLHKMLKSCNNEREIYLLTTHQVPIHRAQIIEEIREKLSKNDKKIVLVSTQLIEAGVDLDFDIGFREFAPFGSIIQSAGRVNREGKNSMTDVVVFNYLDGKPHPYHDTDLQEEFIKDTLLNNIKESEIYEILENYFKVARSQTTSVNLLKYATNLDFETLFCEFNKNFMPQQKWKVSLFIEEYENHFEDFLNKREDLLNSNSDRFEIMADIKEREKDLSLHTICVNESLIKSSGINGFKEMFGRYILPYSVWKDSGIYSKQDGFNPEITRIEEAFT
ncbi:CRISPR-associated helicase Cas3' [Campylobacter sp. 7477a]|uniref:CRISPR-associated helicase Cas3' n=1 Tax=Campylobacter sp. 7477a TaxID=2735741 RepID=UPI003014A92A|nr:CRISPR-associated helicase Cas3' [Campylobacter sp. 7477a]